MGEDPLGCNNPPVGTVVVTAVCPKGEWSYSVPEIGHRGWYQTGGSFRVVTSQSRSNFVVG